MLALIESTRSDWHKRATPIAIGWSFVIPNRHFRQQFRWVPIAREQRLDAVGGRTFDRNHQLPQNHGSKHSRIGILSQQKDQAHQTGSPSNHASLQSSLPPELFSSHASFPIRPRTTKRHAKKTRARPNNVCVFIMPIAVSSLRGKILTFQQQNTPTR
jgi:hypothetical protein